MGKFKADIRGKVVKLKHYSTHSANCQRVSFLRFLEGCKKRGIKVDSSMKEVYRTAFNMGYKHGRKRHLSLRNKLDSQKDGGKS